MSPPRSPTRPPAPAAGYDLLTDAEDLACIDELHAWIWQHNASGMFSIWNPDASCAT